MPSRSLFITAGAGLAAAGLSGLLDPTQSAAAPKGPSEFALDQAKNLQKLLPQAHLSDELVKKIAGDIDGYAPIATAFRKGHLQNWDEPDFIFVAGPTVRQS